MNWVPNRLIEVIDLEKRVVGTTDYQFTWFLSRNLGCLSIPAPVCRWRPQLNSKLIIGAVGGVGPNRRTSLLFHIESESDYAANIAEVVIKEPQVLVHRVNTDELTLKADLLQAHLIDVNRAAHLNPQTVFL